VTVRPATAADVPAIADLELDNLGADAWSEGLVREGVVGNLPTISYLVAEVDAPGGGKSVVGHATASVVADIAELQRIAVDPGHRRTGVASELLDAVVALAREGGADRLLLEVREDNDGAIAFYAAREFVAVDRRRRYYRHGPTAVVLRRGLVRGCGGQGR
jgi:ribosomal-protein-alanine N-acetyltransferase